MTKYYLQGVMLRLKNWLLAPSYTVAELDQQRRIRMVILLTLFHLGLITLAALQFLPSGTLPLPIVVQFTLNGTVLALMYARKFQWGFVLLIGTFVLSHFFVLFFSDLTNLLYIVTSFVAASVLLKRQYRLPYALLIVALVVLAGQWTAGQPQYASVSHANVVLFVIVGLLSVVVSTSVVEGDVAQIREQLQTLRQSEARYRLLAENINDMVTLYTPELKLMYASPSYTRATGFSEVELMAMPLEEFWSYVQLDGRHVVSETAYHQIEGRTIATFQYRHQRKDGTCFWAETFSVPIFDEQGKIVQIVSSSRDITERIHMEEALRDSEQRAQALIAALPDQVFRVARDGMVLDMGGNIKEALFPPEQTIGQSMTSLLSLPNMPPDLLAQSNSMVQKTLDEQQTQVFEYYLDYPTLGRQEFESRLVPSGTNEVIAIVRNITQRKQAQQALALRNQYLTTLHQISLDILQRRDMDDLLSALVQNAASIMDAPFAKLMLMEDDSMVVRAFTANQPFLKGDKSQRTEGFLSQLAWQAYDTKQPTLLADYVVVAKERAIENAPPLGAVGNFPILIGEKCIGVLGLARMARAYPFTPEQIEFGQMFSRMAALVVDNITQYNAALQELAERQHIEKALRLSEHRAQTLLAAIPDQVYRLAPDATILDVGGNLDQAYLNPKALVGKNLRELFQLSDIPHSLIEYWVTTIEQTAAQQQPQSLEYRMQYPQHGTQDFEARLHPISSDEIIVIIRNVTDRKRAEQALAIRNEYLLTLYEISLDVLHRRDLDDLLQALVNNVCRILDAAYADVKLQENDVLMIRAVTEEHLIIKGEHVQFGEGQLTWQAYQTQRPAIVDDYSTWEQRRTIFDAMPVHAVANFPIVIGDACIGVLGIARSQPDYPFTPEEIEIGMMLSRMAALVVDNVTQYNAALQEITERQQAQEALRQSEHRAQAFLNAIPDQMYRIAGDGTVIDASGNLTDGFYSPEQVVGRNVHDLLDIPSIPSEFIPNTFSGIQTALATSQVYILEYYIDFPDKRLHFEMRLVPNREDEVTAIVRNVTESKRLERALQEKQEQLKEAQHLTQLGSWRWDVATNIITWSDELHDIFGIPLEDFRGTYDEYLALLHPNDRDYANQIIQNAYKNRSAYSFFHRIVHPHRGERIIHGRGQVMVDANDKVQYFVGTAQDVTELKHTEQALAVRNKYLTALHQISLDLLHRRNLDDLLQALVDNASVIMDAPYCEMMLKEGDALVVHSFTKNQIFLKGDRVLRHEAKLSWQAHDTRQPAIVEDYSAWSDKRVVYDAIQLRAVADFPVIIGDECIGVLCMSRNEKNYPFTPEEIEIGVMFSQMAALVVDNIHHYHAALQEIAERQQTQEALRLSEQRAQALLAAIPDQVYRATADGIVLDAKGNLTDAYIPAEKLVGRNIWEFVDENVTPELVAYGFQMVKNALAHRQVQTFEYRRPSRTGHMQDYEARLVASSDDEIMLIIRNITERKQLDRALRESNQRYDELVRNIPVLVYRFRMTPDNHFFFDYLSPRCKEFTGIEIEDAMRDARLLHGNLFQEDRLRYWELTRISRTALTPFQFEGRVMIKDELRWIRLESRPKQLENGDVIWDGIRSDITAQKLNELRQHQLTNELQAVNTELKDFAYIISHDLKAPLRGINTIANWLLSDYAHMLDDAGHEMLHLLNKRVHRMEAMINGVLEYSRLGQQSNAIRTDLNHLIAHIIEDIVPNNSCQIIVDTPLPICRADPMRLRQIFQNLIDNAIKYMDKPQGEIHIACEQHGDQWRFSVRDNGPGIEARYFEKIFHIFQTLQPRDEMESTGIGLTIVKRIIEVYGGEIWVESAIGKGSTFLFTLPLEIMP